MAEQGTQESHGQVRASAGPTELDIDPDRDADLMAARQCARHPKVETRLSCGRCGTPICPKCMVYTPTGIRCPDCAQVRRMPQYELTPRVYARVIPGALALSLGIGFVLSFVGAIGFFGGIIVGMLVAAGLKRVSGYKQGREMEIIAGVSVVLTVLSGHVFAALRVGGLAALGPALQHVLLLQTLGFDALGIALGIYFAIQQLR